MKNRKTKLVALKQFADLQTGQLHTDSFDYENTLYTKAVKMKALNAKIAKCKKCPGLNIKRFTENCSGWGDLNSPIFFVGQSLHEPGVLSGLPFILASGYCIDAALRLSSLLRKDVFMSNVVHCHPEKNRGSMAEEKDNCLKFLNTEIDIVQPKLIVALGNDAKEALRDLPPFNKDGSKNKILKIRHPASFMYSAPEDRIDWIVKLSLEMDKCI